MKNALSAIQESYDRVNNFLSNRLQQPQRMGERTESRNTLGINHPLAESSAVARVPISMLPFVGGGASGYTQEDLATLQLPEETTLFSLGRRDTGRQSGQRPSFNVTDKDLAKFGLATDALDWIPGVAIAGGLATTAGLLGKALKGPGYADTTGSGWGEAFEQAVGGMGARTAIGDPVNSLIDATVYHGSPHKFDKFDSAHIGTGEGNQAYGYGAPYLADNTDVAGTYQRATSFADTKRKFLEDLPEDSEFEDLIDLMGTGRFSENQEAVIRALEKDDWLGFDYPSQAISAAYSKNLSNWDPSDELRDAVNNAGHLYTVDLPNEHIANMLDFNVPLSEQPESVRDYIGKLDGVPEHKLQSAQNKFDEMELDANNDRDLYNAWNTGGLKELAFDYIGGNETSAIRRKLNQAFKNYADTEDAGDFLKGLERNKGLSVGDALAKAGIGKDAEISQRIQALGFPGIKYYDGGSRAAGEGTRNYVMFPGNEHMASITHRNGEPVNTLADVAEGRSAGENFIDEIQKQLADNDSVFIRWSGGEARDLEPGRVSRDLATGVKHSGLSAIEITKDMDVEDIATYLSEYGFGRMQNPADVPIVYGGSRVGTDSDGYASFKPSKMLLKADAEVIADIDSGLSKRIVNQGNLARARKSLAGLEKRGDVDTIGYKIVQKSIADLEIVQKSIADLARERSKRKVSATKAKPVNTLAMDEASRMASDSDIPYEDLMISQHNLTEANVLNAERLGGLPMPSIGIAKAGSPISGYGEVTLLGGSDLATPSRTNKVHSADAYSPRYPSLTYQMKNSKAVAKELAGSMEEMGDSYLRVLDGDFDTSGSRALENDETVMHAFLKKNGIDPEVIRREKPDQMGRFRVDPSPSKSKMRQQIESAGSMDDFIAYTKELTELGETEERIFKGFTNAGNRRYAPHTLDNVVREMKTSDGESASMFGAGAFRSKVAPKFKNLKEIQKARNRLVGPEQAGEFKTRANDTLSALASELSDYSNYSNPNSFMATDVAMTNMMEVAQGKAKWDEWFTGVPDELKNKVGSFVKELQDMPTEYFEAKPRRAVGLDEFKGAIVPNDAAPGVLNALRSRGIDRIEKYGTPEERISQLKKFRDLMFSAAPFAAAGLANSLYRPESDKKL